MEGCSQLGGNMMRTRWRTLCVSLKLCTLLKSYARRSQGEILENCAGVTLRRIGLWTSAPKLLRDVFEQCQSSFGAPLQSPLRRGVISAQLSSTPPLSMGAS